MKQNSTPKKITRQTLPILFCLALFFYSFPSKTFAEGTKQIRPSESDHGYLVIDANWSTFGLYDSPKETRLHISICKPGEKVFFGFRQRAGEGNFKYRIKDPSGNIIVNPTNIPTNGKGFISTYNEAVAGPRQIVGNTGYNAESFTPTQTGDYYIEFENTGARRDLELFDITVVNANNEPLNGRIWSQAWMISTRSFVNEFKGKFFIYADDGIVTSLDFNGMQPFVFVISANQTGTSITGNPIEDRKSKPGNVTYPKYKIFLNDPDNNCYPTGTFGNLVGDPTITGCGSDRCINLNVDRPGDVSILLDLNGVQGFQPKTRDRQIAASVNAGMNCVKWDGLDGLGGSIAPGTQINLQIDYFNGLTHLPIFDVEAQPKGYVVELVRPTSSSRPRLFWDDTNIPAAGNNAFNLTGCSNVTGCHTWKWSGRDNPETDYGNRNTINTWWYANIINSNVPYTVNTVIVDADTNNPPGIPNDSTVCADISTFQLNGGVIGAPGGSWIGGNGTFGNRNSPITTYTPTAAEKKAGFVKLTLTSTGTNPCPSASDTLRIFFAPAPTANAGGNKTVCKNNPTIDLNGSVTNAKRIKWSGGKGSFTPNDSTLKAVYSPTVGEITAGTLQLTLTAYGDEVCAPFPATSNMLITFIDGPVAHAGPDSSICPGSSMTLNGKVTGASSPSGTWTGGTGSFSPDRNALNPAYTPSNSEINAGFVILTLTTTNNGACNAVSDEVKISFTGKPTVDAGTDVSMCENRDTIKLVGKIINAPGATWSGGSGKFVNPNTPSTEYIPTLLERSTRSPVTLTLTTTSFGTCPSASDKVVVNFSEAPKVNGGPDIVICENKPEVKLNASVVGAGGMKWTNLKGKFVPNNTTPNVIYTPTPEELQAGNIFAHVITTVHGHCAPVRDTIMISVSPAPTADAGIDQTVCETSPIVNLSAKLPSSPFNMAWTGGSGKFSDPVKPLTQYTPSSTEMNAGSATLVLKVSRNFCNDVFDTVKVFYKKAPIVNAGTPQTLCANNSKVKLSGTTSNATNPLWSGGKGTFLPNTSSLNAEYTPTTNEISSGSVKLYLKATGDAVCKEVKDSVIITFTPAPTIDAGNPPSVCGNNAQVSLKGTVSGASGMTWSGAGSFSPKTNNVNVTYTPTNAEIAASRAIVYLTSTGNGNCLPVKDSAIINITPSPIADAGKDIAICANNSTVKLDGKLTSATAAIWTGGQGTFSPNANTLNATYSPTVAEIASKLFKLVLTTTKQGDCNAVSDTLNIFVTPAPTVNAGASQTICESNTGVTLDGSVTVATGGLWTTTGSGIFSPSGAALKSEYKPSTQDIANKQITLTLTSTGNGNCTAVSDEMTITFAPRAKVEAGANQTVCSNDVPVQLNGSGSPGIWSTNGSGTFSPNNQTLNAKYAPSSADLLKGNVILTLTSNKSNSCPQVSDNVTITFKKAPLANAGSDQTICGNDNSIPLNQTISNSNGGTWFTSGTGSFSPSSITSNPTYTFSPKDKETGKITLSLVTFSDGYCSSDTDDVVITILPAVTVNAGPDKSVCANVQNIELNGEVTTATNVLWTTSGTGKFLPNANSINATYAPSSADTTAKSVTLTLTSSSTGSCPAIADVMKLSFTPAPKANAGQDQVICADSGKIILSGNVTVATNGMWSTTGSGNFSPSPATLSTTYTPTEEDKASGSITFKLTTSDNGNCNASSDDMVVKINPQPVAEAGDDQEICANAEEVNLNGSVTIAGGGVWTTSGTGNFTPNNQALNAKYIPTKADLSAGSFSLTLTSNNNGNCKAVSDKIIVSVKPNPTVNAGLDRNICADTNLVSIKGFVTVATTGKWTSTSNGNFENPYALETIYTLSATDKASSKATLILSTSDNGSCKPVSDTLVINILPAPMVNAGESLTVCEDTIGITLTGKVENATNGIWSSNGSGIFYPSVNDKNAKYAPSDNDKAKGSVVLTLTSTGNGTCKAVQDTLTLTINPAPVVNAGLDKIICATNDTIHLNGKVSVASINNGQWSTSGSGAFSPSQTDLNAIYTFSKEDKLAGKVSLTLVSSNNALCKAVADQMIVNITPAPIVNAGNDKIICDDLEKISLSGTVTIASGGNWSTTGSGVFMPNNTLNTEYLISTQDKQNGNIRVILTSSGNGLCKAISDTVEVSFNPTPNVNAGSDQTICSNINSVDLNGTVKAAEGAIWTSNGSGKFVPSANVLNAKYIPSLADTASGQVELTITSVGNGNCKEASDKVLITLTDAPSVDAGADQTVCSNWDAPIKLNGKITIATSGEWASSGTGTFSPSNQGETTGYILSQQDLTVGKVALTLTTSNNGGCLPVSDQLILNITPAPKVNAGADFTVCANTTDITLNGTVSGSSDLVWSTSGTGSFTNANTQATTYKPSAADTASQYVILTLSAPGDNNCLIESDNIKVSFAPIPTVSAGSNQTVCSDTSGILLNGSFNHAAGVTWTTSGKGFFSPSNASPQAKYILAQEDINANSVTVTLTTIGNGSCNAASASSIITINAKPIVDAGTDQTICANNSSVTLNGTVNNATGAVWNTNSGTGIFTPNVNNLNATFNPSAQQIANGNAILTLTSSGNGICKAAQDVVTINITPTPTISAGNDLSVCDGNGNINLNGSVQVAGGVQWEILSGAGSIVNPNSAITNYSPNGQDKIPTANPVTLKLTSTNNGNCLAVSDTMRIKFTPSPTLNAGPDQTVCSNNYPAKLNGTGTVGRWTTSGTGTFSDNNSLNSSYIPSKADSTTGSVTLTLTSTDQGCPISPDQMVLTIIAGPTANAGADQTLCANNAAISLSGNVTGATNGTWTTDGSGSFANKDLLNTTYTPSEGDLVSGSVMLTLTTTDNGGCKASSDKMIVNFTTAPTSFAGEDRTICANITEANVAGSVTLAGGGNWTTSGSGNFEKANELATIYKISPLDVQAGSVKLSLTTNTYSNCKVETDEMTIRFTPGPIASTGPNHTVCNNANVISLKGSVINATGGVWSTSNGTGNFSPSPSDLNATYVPSEADRTLNKINLVLTTTGNGSCNAEQVTNEISLIAAPLANAGTDIVACGDTAKIQLQGSATETTSFSWASSGTGKFEPNNSTLTATYTPSEEDKKQQLVTLELTATGNAACPASIDYVTINLTNTPIIFGGFDESFCADAIEVPLKATAMVAQGGTWTTLGNGTFSPQNDLITSYIPSNEDKTSGSVKLIVTSTGNGNCKAAKDTIQISFTPSPTVNPGSDQTVCADTFGIKLNGNVTIAKGGRWSTSGSGKFLPNANNLNAIYIPSQGDTANKNVILTLTSTNNGTCKAIAKSIEVKITPAPVAFAGSNQTVCSDNNEITLQGSATVASGGIWTSSGTGKFSPSANQFNATYLPSEMDKKAGGVNLILTTTGNGDCKPTLDVLNITITPAPVAAVNAGFDQTICADGSAPLNGIVRIAEGGIWTTTGSGTFSPTTSTLNASYIPSATDTANKQVELILTTTGNGLCKAVADTMLLDLKPKPVVSAGKSSTVCADTVGIPLKGSISNSPGGIWKTSGTGNFVPDATNLNATYIPSTNDIESGRVGLTLISSDSDPCASVSNAITITIRPKPVVNAGTDLTVCADANGVLLNGTGTLWQTKGKGTFSPSNGARTTYLFDLEDISAGFVNLKLVAIGTGTCKTISDDLLVKILPTPMVDAGIEQTFCSDISEINLRGSVKNAKSGQWSIHNGYGNFITSTDTVVSKYAPSSVDFEKGSVVLKLTSTGNASCMAASDSVIFTFTPKPVVSATTINICAFKEGAELNGEVENAMGGRWVSSGTGSFSPDAFTLNGSYIPSNADISKGNVVLTLISTGNGTCKEVSSKTNLVISAPPVANAGPDKTICGDSIRLTAQTIPGVKYLWQDDLGIKLSDASTFAHSVNEGPISQISLKVTDNKGCFSWDSIRITKVKAPTLSLNDRYCFSDTLVLDAKPKDLPAGNGVFQWFNNGTLIYNQNKAIIPVSKPAIYKITYTFGNCVVSDLASITAPPIIQPNDIFGCVNANTLVSIKAINNTTYKWVFKKDTLASKSNFTNIIALPDTNFYKVVVTDQLKCSSIDSVQVIGIPAPKVKVNDSTTCSSTVILKATPLNIKGVENMNITYTWSKDGKALKSNADSLVVVRADSGLYRVSLKVEGCPGSDSSKVKFLPVPSNLTQKEYKICEPDHVTINAGGNTGDKYKWLPTNQTTQTITVGTPGVYYVTVTNKYNCTTADSVMLIRSCPPTLHVPNVFIPTLEDVNSPDKYFKVFGQYFINYKLIVFSRWGEILFTTEDRNQHWDGTYKGVIMPEGVYPYLITYEGESPDYKGPYKKEGQIIIIR